MDGFLCVDKTGGVTSRQVVNQIQRWVRPCKVGHAGTLDPIATGVLVVAVGKATRLISFVQRMQKEYVAEFTLGVTSDTEDITGHVEPVVHTPPGLASLTDVVQQFKGRIHQRPPLYSALNVRGRRAYEYARSGQTVELAEREVVIDEIEIVSYQYPQLVARILCGTGTYVRSLGRDIGDQLGCGAVMSQLRRIGIGVFRIDNAASQDQLNDLSAIQNGLLAPISGVTALPTVTMDQSQLDDLSFGGKIQLSHTAEEISAVTPTGDLAAVLRRTNDGTYRPAINLIAR